MERQLPLLLTALCITFSGIVSAQESGFSVGAGVGSGESPYKDYSNDATWLPYISLENGNFYVRGLSAGYTLYDAEKQQLSIELSYKPEAFDPSDSSDSQMKLLDERKETYLGAIKYRYRMGLVDWFTAASADLSDRSDEVSVNAGVAINLPFSERIYIRPAMGVEWMNASGIDYLYGISNVESVRSGLATYHPGSTTQPFASLMARFALTKQLALSLNGRVIYLSDEVKESPMVDKSTSYNVSAFIVYKY